MSAASLLASLFQYKAWANEELFALMQSVDAATHDSERHAAIRILNHIYVVDRIFAGHLQGVAHGYAATNTPETPSLDALHEAVRRTDRWYVEHIAGLSADALAEAIPFTFTDGSAACMTREEMLAHVATHGGYHRGAVGRILAQLGIAPPRDIFSGFLHKAEPGRRKSS
ncbi:MAG: DinB family protein [Pseudomonadota bacterium]